MRGASTPASPGNTKTARVGGGLRVGGRLVEAVRGLVAASPLQCLPGAHVFLGGDRDGGGGHMWLKYRCAGSATDSAKYHRRRKGRRPACPLAGQAVDSAISTWAAAYPAPLPLSGCKATEAAVALLSSRNFTPLATQVRIVAPTLGCSPVVDIVGYFAQRPNHIAVIEVKFGGTTFSHQRPGTETHMLPPHEALRDTWRNRCMAQLALQVLAIEARCRADVAPRLGVDGFLLMITNTQPPVASLAPLCKRLKSSLQCALR